VPLVPLRETDEYTTVHSMNTSVLSMAMGEFLHLAGPEVHIIGEAALLHDVGKVAVPKEILNKPDKLEDAEWEVIKRHPVDGAKIILKSGEGLDIAALAAYEHHLKWNGGGYPELKFARRPHRVSQLVHLCDAYDAMRTKRPFQDPLDHEEILQILERGAGIDHDPELVNNFLTMMRQWESRIVITESVAV
jgi:putative nucleotidyltransferase with HDIG domain